MTGRRIACVGCAGSVVLTAILLLVAGLAVGSEITDQVIDPGTDGREYMRAQPCSEVLIEYRAMRDLGHDPAVTHVSNVYNAKTMARPYIALSDVSARLEECRV